MIFVGSFHTFHFEKLNHLIFFVEIIKILLISFKLNCNIFHFQEYTPFITNLVELAVKKFHKLPYPKM